MKRLIFLAAAALMGLTSCSTYNNMVNRDEGVSAAWADVQTQYQRRADLIPNLVNTVKGYAQHEQSTLDRVVEARAKATSINLSADQLTEESMAEFQRAQSEVRSALGRLIAISESYPDLKANQNFMELQAQIEGTENRISVARSNFNTATREYNMAIRRFPANLIAMMFSFKPKPYFESDASAAAAPEVQF